MFYSLKTYYTKLQLKFVLFEPFEARYVLQIGEANRRNRSGFDKNFI